MKRRFVLIAEELTAQEADAVTHWLSQRMGYWHWIPNAWIIVSTTDLTAANIRDAVRIFTGEKTLVVLEILDRATWAGFGIPDKFKWFEELFD